MDPTMLIMARLLLEFATRQGISSVSVSDPDGDWEAKRFAIFLSRKIPTRTIAHHDMEKLRLPKSEVQLQYDVIEKILSPF